MKLNWRDASKELPDQDMVCECILEPDKDEEDKEDYLVVLFFNHPTKLFIEGIMRFYSYDVAYWRPIKRVLTPEE